MRRAGALLVTGAIWLVLGPASASAADAETKIKIKSFDESSPIISVPGTWHGTLRSADKGCLNNRDVKLFFQDPEDGKELIGPTTSEKKGKKAKWAVDDDNVSEGSYFAKVDKTGDCKGAKSKPYTYPDDPGRARAGNGVTPSKVKIDGFSQFVGEGDIDGVWVGRVTTTGAKGCVQDRKVTMFRKRSGRDQRIGSDRTPADDNQWEVEANLPMRKTYYAKVKATQACAGDKSQNFKYPQDQPN